MSVFDPPLTILLNKAYVEMGSTSLYNRYVPIWKIFDYAKTGSRRSVELPKDLKKYYMTYLA